MLLCKKQSSKRYFLRIHITLRSPYVSTESIDTASFASEFRLICKTRSFILFAATNEERAEWIADLEKSIKGTHTEELRATGKLENEEKKDQRQAIAKLPTESKSKPPTLLVDSGGARSQSATTIPTKKKKQSSNARMSMVATPTQQPTQTTQPKQRKAQDDSNLRPKTTTGGQQLTNDPNLFVYQSPTVTNNPFIDLPQQQKTFAPNSNPFATNVYSSNQRPQSMMMPQSSNFGATNNQQRPQSMVYNNPNPFATNVSTNPNPQVMPNPFATNITANNNNNLQAKSNPFATNVNPPSNPFLTNINQQPAQRVSPRQQVNPNPFATNVSNSPSGY